MSDGFYEHVWRRLNHVETSLNKNQEGLQVGRAISRVCRVTHPDMP